MTKSKLPKSIRVYIRNQKAKLRKTVQNPQELEAAFDALYQKLKVSYNKGI